MSFFQLLRALFAANFNRFAADGDLDRVFIQFVVANRTSSFRHDSLQIREISRANASDHGGENTRYQNL